MKGSSRRFRLSSVVLSVVLICSALLLGLCYLSMYVNPADFWPSALLTVIEFPVAIINVVLLLVTVIRGSRLFWIPLVALVPFLFIADKQVRLSGKEGGDGLPGDTLKILSYNVGGFRLAQDGRKGEDHMSSVREDAMSVLEGCSPDILCFQEFSIASADSLELLVDEYFEGYYYKYYFRNDAGAYSGNLTLSRFPITSSGVERFKQSSNLALYSDIDIGGKTIRVYNCHFQSYSISTAGLVKSMVEDKEVARMTGERVRGSILKRPKQVGQVLENMRNSPYEALICGDFNDTPMSYTYRTLVKGRKDTFSEAGSGFAATYSRLWPLLRIDYVFVPEFFSVLSHETPRLKFSDHYPVMAVMKY